ncbi:response regulator transcription factor [Trinickia violacea]|uniref:Response regulator transcription factor n=1 Tax=Trinickia violacea TaxID=2571746 RepID=A0A4P8ITR0_9BURK|nr:response regulator transcription factor [Trinickia violacea]QCP51175.1 response regulator transcription factor [Trinickia violacea]
MKIIITVADNHPTLIVGIKHELAGIPTLDVAGTACNSTEIVNLLSSVSCGILIIDYAMPGDEFGDGMALLSFLRQRYQDVRIIVFTSLGNPATAAGIARPGIQSVLDKVAEIGHLFSAIHAGATGMEQPKAPHNSRSLPNPVSAAELTRREAEVVRLYTSGMSINEIAALMKRTKQTISSQKMSAMHKLGIERDAELFRFAYETGLAGAAPWD